MCVPCRPTFGGRFWSLRGVVAGGLASRPVDEIFFSRGGMESAFACLDPDSREEIFGGMWTTSAA